MRSEEVVAQFFAETPVVRRRRRVSAFQPAYRRRITALMAKSSELEDLAESFPALLFALATDYGTAEHRRAAIDIVRSGLTLREAATALGLPMWLRRIPPIALRQPLPPIPYDGEFTSIVTNRIPDAPMECADWFERVILALTLVGRDFAIWCAREPKLLLRYMSEEEFHWLLAWAWTSMMPATPGHELLRLKWAPAMSWKRAREEFVIWRKRIGLIPALAGGPSDPWFVDGGALGYTIVRLVTASDFIAESIAMENCLDQYAAHLAYGRVRVFSVRRAGRPMANVELSLRSDDVTMPGVMQVRGPRNRKAQPLVWQAVHAWLGAQPFRSLSPTPTSPTVAREALGAFWAPYLEAINRLGLPARTASIAKYDDGRRTLARRQPDLLRALARPALE